jgi:hypothetical protein
MNSTPACYAEVGGISGPHLMRPCGLGVILLARHKLHPLKLSPPSDHHAESATRFTIWAKTDSTNNMSTCFLRGSVGRGIHLDDSTAVNEHQPQLEYRGVLMWEYHQPPRTKGEMGGCAMLETSFQLFPCLLELTNSRLRCRMSAFTSWPSMSAIRSLPKASLRSSSGFILTSALVCSDRVSSMLPPLKSHQTGKGGRLCPPFHSSRPILVLAYHLHGISKSARIARIVRIPKNAAATTARPAAMHFVALQYSYGTQVIQRPPSGCQPHDAASLHSDRVI